MLALFSCFDKSKASIFAKALTDLNYQIIASLGTYKYLLSENIEASSIESITGFSQLLEGRVKTLDSKIHASILANKSNPKHLTDLNNHNLIAFDLVYVDLYPFKKTVASKISDEQIIEMIDIGGVSLIRAAAKNYKNVLVISSSSQISTVVKAIKNSELNNKFRQNLAKEAFSNIAKYDMEIAKWFDNQAKADHKIDKKPSDDYPFWEDNFTKIKELRYGENPHQKASIYSNNTSDGGKTVFGDQSNLILAKETNYKSNKDLSYNNILDAKHAYKLVIEIESSFDKIKSEDTNKQAINDICAIIKHGNPCGCAFANSQTEAFSKAHLADDISAFGGICAFNNIVSASTAKLIIKNFFEVIIAPNFSADALKIFSSKKNLRLIAYKKEDFHIPFDIQTIPFGYLRQNTDNIVVDKNDLTIVAQPDKTIIDFQPFLFAWQIAKSSNSNAIVIIGARQKSMVSLGIGLGQTNRLLASKIATEQLKNSKLFEDSYQLYAASDGFFPFTDGLQQLVDNGVSNVIQPSGSINDKDIIKFAHQKKLNLIFANIRHFKH